MLCDCEMVSVFCCSMSVLKARHRFSPSYHSGGLRGENFVIFVLHLIVVIISTLCLKKTWTLGLFFKLLQQSWFNSNKFWLWNNNNNREEGSRQHKENKWTSVLLRTLRHTHESMHFSAVLLQDSLPALTARTERSYPALYCILNF